MHRAIPSAICLILAVSATVQAQVSGAKQIGPSCAFYANIPALTSITGVNIADGTDTSLAFIKSVYGLRKGDFKIQTPYKKELFFALFGIETKTHNHYLPPQRASLLLETSSKLIEKEIIPALQLDQFISARVKGRSGRSHNILLLDYREKRFSYHNPTTGKIYTCDQKSLSEKILTKSTLHKNKVRPEYFIHYLTISKGQKKNSSILPISKLPDKITISLSDEQKEAVRTAFQQSAHPKIDWVQLKKKDRFVDAIDSKLKSTQLAGLANISRLSLQAYRSKHRDLLPVMLLDGKPQVLISYKGTSPAQLSFFDGKNLQLLNLKEALTRLKSSGIKFGYLSVPHE